MKRKSSFSRPTILIDNATLKSFIELLGRLPKVKGIR